MATSAPSTSRRARPRRATRAKAKTARAKPAAHRRRKTAKAHRASAKTPVAGAASAALRRFAKLLTSVRASAAHLTAEQRALLKKALKHAHAALD